MRLKASAFCLVILCAGSVATCAARGENFRPNRVFVLIGGQWDDPTSFLIHEGNEFHEIASLLKNWGIPFDVVRLDQQKLDRNIFLGYDGGALYGAILWDAAPSLAKDQDYALLADAVEKWNIGLVAVSNRIDQPVLESLLGIHRRQPGRSDHREWNWNHQTAAGTGRAQSGNPAPSAGTGFAVMRVEKTFQEQTASPSERASGGSISRCRSKAILRPGLAVRRPLPAKFQ